MAKIKVGLYLVNNGYKDLDLSKPEDGNPGIGGTQYCIVSLPYYYTKYYDDVEFIFYAQIHDTLPTSFVSKQVNSLLEAAQIAKHDKCDIFIYRPTADIEEFNFLNQLNKIHIKTVAWAHNTPFKCLDSIASNPYVVRYVNVGKEQYDMLRDHPIIYKSSMIYNGFDSKIYIPKTKVKKEKLVVFIGSIIPEKGFHALAEIWKKVLDQVPDAKLEVIGSGQLYNRESQLGKWNVADESYESIFRPFLSDGKGKKLDSVIFHGVLGNEKTVIMQKARVGCLTPSAVETFGLTAVEFQACGTTVVSKAAWGYLDTVDNGKTGILGKTEDELFKNIITLLQDGEQATQLGNNGIAFINKKFNYKTISSNWHDLFQDIMNNKKAKILPIDQNPNFEYKQFSEKMRQVKEKYIFLKWIPPYIKIRPYHRRIKKLLGITI